MLTVGTSKNSTRFFTEFWKSAKIGIWFLKTRFLFLWRDPWITLSRKNDTVKYMKKYLSSSLIIAKLIKHYHKRFAQHARCFFIYSLKILNSFIFFLNSLKRAILRLSVCVCMHSRILRSLSADDVFPRLDRF